MSAAARWRMSERERRRRMRLEREDTRYVDAGSMIDEDQSSENSPDDEEDITMAMTVTAQEAGPSQPTETPGQETFQLPEANNALDEFRHILLMEPLDD